MGWQGRAGQGRAWDGMGWDGMCVRANVCMPACVYAPLSVCLSVYRSVCLAASMQACICVCMRLLYDCICRCYMYIRMFKITHTKAYAHLSEKTSNR